LFRQLPLKQQIWPENASSGGTVTGYDNSMDLVFVLSEDEKAHLSDFAGVDAEEFRAYLRGFKMTVFDNSWDHRKCKTPAE
jgi:transposase-like protein